MLAIRRLGYLTFALGCTLGAQSAGPRTIAVVDASGVSIPHAVSQIGGATPQVANAVLRRGDCAMTTLIDGRLVNGTVQDGLRHLSATVVPGTPRASAARGAGGRAISIDDLVGANEIMAIEIYPSLANAPDELIPLTGGGDCGLIAIWTGGRS